MTSSQPIFGRFTCKNVPRGQNYYIGDEKVAWNRHNGVFSTCNISNSSVEFLAGFLQTSTRRLLTLSLFIVVRPWDPGSKITNPCPASISKKNIIGPLFPLLFRYFLHRPYMSNMTPWGVQVYPQIDTQHVLWIFSNAWGDKQAIYSKFCDV